MPLSVPAVDKAVRILRFLNRRGDNGGALPEISAALGLTRSHCFNILGTLLAQGWLAHDSATHRYRLAAGLLADCSSLMVAPGRAEAVRDILRGLSRAAGLPSVLTRVLPGDGGFVALDKAEETSELIISFPIGHVFPADSPAQRRAVLACLDPARAAAWIEAWRPVAYTANTIVDRATLVAEIAATRQRGYAVSRGELHLAVMSLATAVRDQSGEPTFVLQLPGLFDDVTGREAEIARALLDATSRLEALRS